MILVFIFGFLLSLEQKVKDSEHRLSPVVQRPLSRGSSSILSKEEGDCQLYLPNWWAKLLGLSKHVVASVWILLYFWRIRHATYDIFDESEQHSWWVNMLTPLGWTMFPFMKSGIIASSADEFCWYYKGAGIKWININHHDCSQMNGQSWTQWWLW